MLKKAAIAASGGFARHFLLQLVLPLVITVPVWCVSVTAIETYALSGQTSEVEAPTAFALVCVPLLLIVAIGCWIILSASVAFARERRAVERETSACDAACVSIGLKLSGTNSEGRRYFGVVNLRPVSVYLYPGPTVDIHVQTPLPAFVSVLEKDAMARSVNSVLVGKRPQDLGIPELSRFDIYAADSRWAHTFLSDSRVKEVVLRFMARTNGTESRHFRLESSGGLLKLDRTSISNLSESHLRAWLTDLMTVIQIAESLPPPQDPLPSTPFASDGRLYAWKRLLPFATATVCIGVLSTLLYPMVFCSALYTVAFAMVHSWVDWIARQLAGLG